MNCIVCSTEANTSALCKNCIKDRKHYKKARDYMYTIIERTGDCYHCEKKFSEEYLCLDHIIIKASRPDLRFDKRVLRWCCAPCNVSDSKNRKPAPLIPFPNFL